MIDGDEIGLAWLVAPSIPLPRQNCRRHRDPEVECPVLLPANDAHSLGPGADGNPVGRPLLLPRRYWPARAGRCLTTCYLVDVNAIENRFQRFLRIAEGEGSKTTFPPFCVLLKQLVCVRPLLSMFWNV